MLISSTGLAEIKANIKKNIFFGNKPTPQLMAILLVYFVQGILGLARLAVSFFLKDDLGMTPAEVSAMLGIIALPWVIKPVFGFISDGLPILGYRRRPYLILSGFLGAIAWIALATVVNSPLAATLVITLSSLSVAISDVIVDSLVVERARQESLSDVGSLQSLCWGTSALGGLITAYLSGFLLEIFSVQTIFLITASFPLIVCGVAWLITEEKVNGDRSNLETVKQQLSQLRQAVTQKTIWLPMAFVFIWQATPTADSAFFYFTTNELGFQPEFLGRVRLVTSIASLLGVFLFQRFFKTVPFRKIFAWSTILSSLLGMTTLLLVTHANRALGIDDYWFSLGDSLILTVIGQIAYMPVLVLAARLCPPGVEATLFALLMSVSNLAGLLSYESGALLTHLFGVTENQFDNLWLLVILTNLSTLLPLPFINWLPHVNAQNEGEDSHPQTPISAKIGHHHVPDYVPEYEGIGIRD
ncbi:folate/biopterin family MFS transporter [Limnoraphis robusta]|uniref:Folate/biopterin family MFS transporter n=1 Tax=Limnoraphis robusta CCNP1315 TaxID=3110306 RepID=A0ABU5U342_9CYAN|nr:folate/biopterin family MFS transporter [Limnoraphis robusta]MEA5498239.1 folate/biopterin family MFS transporter [Limnoraphis robusta BA-68 BA1]MEA5521307.1 folate/biopterin family MFS transporter [Limnoraphis robusta CCNP1315]MEA5544849.1 folate/biopterin family MFS transporter [Limnoraphis robusta CCNP1324]